MRLDWTATAEDKKTRKPLFPDGEFTTVPPRKVAVGGKRVLRRVRRSGDTGLLFMGTNRKARRDGARSTRRRGH